MFPGILKHTLILLAGMLGICLVQLAAQTPPATYSVIAIGPSAQGIVQAGDGNFYAPSLKFFQACIDDSTKLCADIYKITPTGTMSTFYEFEREPTSASVTAINKDGIWPTSLIVGIDGALYGTCQYGGPGGFGTIFRITLAGDFTILKSFGPNPGNTAIDVGYSPASMTQGPDGSLYWTNGVGVYQLAPDGSFITLETFQADQTTQLFPQGGNPTSLMLGNDGSLYLTLSTGPQTAHGTGTNGSIARLNLAGNQLTTFHALPDNGSEGAVPVGPLVQGSDGSLYGVTSNHTSTPLYAFRIASDGTLYILHNFTGGADGGGPQAPLFVGSDGNLYGVTLVGGDTTSDNCKPTGCGTVFQLTPNALLTTLHTFEGGTPTSTVVADNPQFDGAVPKAPMVQAMDGAFYGTSLFNAVYKTVLNSAPPAPMKMTLNPTTVVAGNPTTVTWTVSNAFSQTAQACGAYIVGNTIGAGSWSGILKGTMSGGLVYGGTATITPTAGGTYVYAISCGGNESAVATLIVSSNSDLQLAPPGPVTGLVNQPYQLVLTATGGTTPYAFGIAGTIPKGLIWSPAGALTGTPLQYGDYLLTFGVQDSSKPPLQDSKSINLHIDSGLTLLGVAPNPVVGKFYLQTLVATGGISPYTWAFTSGTLPDGLTFNANLGQISGTPTKPGPSTFSITVSDSENPKATQTTTFNLNTGTPELTISLAVPPAAAVGVPYGFSFAATGGTPPYFWTLLPPQNANDVNPPGLTLSLLGGILSGTPNQYSLGTDYFTVQVTDSAIPAATAKEYTGLSVNRTLKITTNSLPNGTVGVPTDIPLTATGGIPPYTWKGSSAPDPNVIGITLVGNVLHYQPIVAGPVHITLYVNDSEVTQDSANVGMDVTFLPAPLATNTTLTTSNNVAGSGQTIILTAKVTISAGGAPPGQIIFYSGTASLGNATLDANGVATLQTSFPANGVYTLTAAYGGNTSYAGSTSTPLTETVVTPGVTAAVSPASLTVQSGSSGQLVITVTPTNGYTGSINFSCGTLPAHVSCTFAPPSLTIAAGSGPVTDTLTVATNSTLAALVHTSERGNSLLNATIFWLPGSLAALAGLVRRKRKTVALRSRNLWLIAILFLAGACALTSCGGTSNIATTGTYKVQVTLTVAGGGTQNVDATVVIQ